MPRGRVRAVGTNTLRRAKNSRSFLSLARKALGHPIEIVSGREEARLIYLGVAHSLSDDAGRRLVVDIGGGSTECIVGERFDCLQEESLHMGCVGYTDRFFPRGKITRDAFRNAQLAARLELQTIERRFKAIGWQECVGASGTILAISEILRESGWSSDGSITRGDMRKLRKALVAAKHTDALSLPGLKPERAPVLAGGLAILLAVFDSLEIKRMRPAQGALREGLLYDLLGRIRHEDVRDRTIRRFEERYHVDREQAFRVERTASELYDLAADAWKLKRRQARLLLIWAARLHEIGLAISYTSHHKHGAYLITHSDMPGFSLDDQGMLAVLIRTQRRKISRALIPDHFPLNRDKLLRLSVLLRLGTLLSRGRSPDPIPLTLEVRKQALSLTFPPKWLEDHPLTMTDLEVEVDRLSAVGYTLSFGEELSDSEAG
jgi:exopolyphosphatase/guanosine-5'-triphosphate,3'-diphosphate pyrophosphatase